MIRTAQLQKCVLLCSIQMMKPVKTVIAHQNSDAAIVLRCLSDDLLKALIQHCLDRILRDHHGHLHHLFQPVRQTLFLLVIQPGLAAVRHQHKAVNRAERPFDETHPHQRLL